MMAIRELPLNDGCKILVNLLSLYGMYFFPLKNVTRYLRKFSRMKKPYLLDIRESLYLEVVFCSCNKSAVVAMEMYKCLIV